MGNQTEATAAVRPASQLSNRAKQIAARATPDKSPNDPNYELQATLTEKQRPAAEESLPTGSLADFKTGGFAAESIIEM
jgi:hypothetical protein